jgi:hypothetical protein
VSEAVEEGCVVDRTIQVNLWFQQDGVPQHVIPQSGDVIWPSCSSDISPPDYFLWGYLKGTVYTTKPATLHDLKQYIIQENENIPKDLMHREMFSFQDRLKQCVQCNGDILNTLFKRGVNHFKICFLNLKSPFTVQYLYTVKVLLLQNGSIFVRFEIFTAVTMKNGVLQLALFLVHRFLSP